ncbi:MAG: hypothetical protein E7450_07920 [Ruminococcaceae bacterium]|nr:hypothetical protein [Oscillospiraceae bacterium]
MEQLRALVSDARDDDFSLEDILAEYSERSRPKHVITLSEDEGDTGDVTDNLLIFPTAAPPPEPEVLLPDGPDEDIPVEPVAEPDHPHPSIQQDETDFEGDFEDDAEDDFEGDFEDDPEPDFRDDDGDDTEDTPPQPTDNVLEFPGLRSPLSSLLQKLSRKADRYAEQMFAEEDDPANDEARRIEELVPGVDREEVSRPTRQRRHAPVSGPDTPPQELAREYGKGLKGLRTRSLIVMVLLLPALYVTLFHLLPIPAIPNPWVAGQHLLTDDIRNWVGAGLLAAAMALSFDVLATGLRQIGQLRINMDAILLLACTFSLADAITAPFLLPTRGQTGFFALNMLALFFALQGEHHRRRGLRLACRTAAASAQPYLITLDERKWSGRDTYAKHAGPPEGFGRQIQAPDGARKLFGIISPVLLCACFLLPTLSCVIGGRFRDLLWALAAVYTAAYSLSSPLLFSRPFHKLSRRLTQCGAAVAGWPGVLEQHRGDGILLGDQDLFPPGSVSLNGLKIFGDWSSERVTGYTATLIRASGSGLDHLFSDLMRTQGILYRQADRLCCYEGGGLSANIRGDQVLVGSASFMTLMEIDLPQGLNVKNAVFCAIDGQLAGIFALNYTLPDAAFPAIDALLQERLAPVLATRDFNIIPAMLQHRFRLAVSRMDFPPVQRRRELSDPEQSHNPVLTAVLCREGIFPLSEAVVGARRLRRTVRLNAVLGCVGSVLGTALACYLTSVSAYPSISPFNLLLFLLLWLIPSWFITGWTNQY